MTQPEVPVLYPYTHGGPGHAMNGQMPPSSLSWYVSKSWQSPLANLGSSEFLCLYISALGEKRAFQSHREQSDPDSAAYIA